MPMAFSAPLSSQAGNPALNAISGIPSARRAVACPIPHQAPSRAALRVSPSSAATSDVTATRWSGSDACRAPSRKAMPSATANGAPSNRLVIRWSRSSTGLNRNSKLIASPPLSHDLRDRPSGQDESEGYDENGRQRRQQEGNAARGDARRHEAPRVDHGDPEPGQRAGEAEAECDDQKHPERHFVLRDRREQHDERRRAREKPGGRAHAEEPGGAEAAGVIVSVRVRVL